MLMSPGSGRLLLSRVLVWQKENGFVSGLPRKRTLILVVPSNLTSLEIKFQYMDEEIVTNMMPTTKNNLYRIFAFSCDSSEISQQSNMLSPPMLDPLRSARSSTPCLRICFSVTELPLEGSLNKVHQ